MANVTQTKAELLDIIKQLQEKIVELSQVEKQITADSKDLKTVGVGLIKDDSTGYYSIVNLKFDIDKNAAVIDSLTKVDSRDEAIVSYKLNQIVSEQIIRKARGGKYDK